MNQQKNTKKSLLQHNNHVPPYGLPWKKKISNS